MKEKLNYSKMFRELIGDPLMIRAKKFQETRMNFELNPISEVDVSNLINWYCIPTESHGLGGEFLMKLLANIDPCKEKENQFIYYKNGKKCYRKFYEVSDLNTSRVLSVTEFAIKNNRRIDNFIYLPDDDLIIVIELKYGSKEQNDQCKAYKKELDEKYPDKEIIYIFWDLCNNDLERVPDEWCSVNSDFLEEFLKSHYYRCNDIDIRNIIKNFYISISENYDFDENFSMAIAAVSELAEKYRDLIVYIKPKVEKISREKDVVSIADDYLDEEFGNFGYWSYENEILLSWMLNFSDFDKIEEALRKKILNFDADYLVDSDHKNIFYITRKDIANSKMCTGKYWPFALYVERKEKIKLCLYLDMNYVESDYSYVPEEIVNYLNDFGENRRVSTGKARITFQLIEFDRFDYFQISEGIYDFIKNHGVLFKLLDKYLK